MPPVKEKEAIVILLDIGNNTAACDESGNTFLDSAKECISKIVQRKLFSSSSDEFGLILIGSKKTKNDLANEDNGRYEHIEVVSNLSLPSWDLLKFISNVTNTPYTGDWLDAIIVTLQYLLEETETKDFIQQKLVLFSNFDQEVCNDSVDAIINKMKCMNVNIVAIGPNILQDSQSKGSNKSYSQANGEALIANIITELHGVICSFYDALAELMYFQRKGVRPTPWNTELTISNQIKIPISGYKKVAELTPIKWLHESIEDKDAHISTERTYFRYDMERGTQIEVRKADVIDGYRFGETIIPFSDIEKKTMNFEGGNKGLYLLSCTPKKNVPHYMLLGSGNYLITSRKDDDTDGKVALEAFITALYKADKVGIARKLYTNNAAVVIGALFPISNPEHKYLIFAELPFKEDEHIFRFPSLSKVPARTNEQSKAVSDLIQNMNLDKTDNQPEQYEPTTTYDPYEQYVYHCIAYKALHPDDMIPDNLVDSVKHMLEPLPEIQENSKSAVDRIKELFPLTVIEKRKKTNHEESKQDVTEDEDNEMEAIEKIGTADPVQDFLLMLKQGTHHAVVCQHMQDTIVQLLALLPEELETPLSALKMLRGSCISKNPNIYNNWMFHLKDFILQKNILPLWNIITIEKLGLITQHESEETDVSGDNAEEFLKVTTNSSNTDSKMDTSENTDDLWDEL